MSTGQNKIYYDVNIPYKAEEKVAKAHFYSKAETEIRLNGPLITDPMNYDLAISKFKIDTECVPVFIPEIKHPTSKDDNVFTELGEAISNYVVTAYYPKCLKNELQYCYKRNDPVKWTEIPATHVLNWEKYDYNQTEESGIIPTQYCGKIVHPLVWTDVDEMALPYDRELYEYKNKHDPNQVRLRVQGPIDWAEIPEIHAYNYLLYEYWDYDGHNLYRRNNWVINGANSDSMKTEEENDETNEEDPWINIPEGHRIDNRIYEYRYNGGEDNPQQMILKGAYPERDVKVPQQHVRDEVNYVYSDDANEELYVYGKDYFPVGLNEIPEGHVRDEEKFVYIEEVTHEEYKAKKEGEVPANWTNVPAQHVRDENKYEYRTVIDEPAKYRGKEIQPQRWTKATDVELYARRPDLFMTKLSWTGTYKGKKPINEEEKNLQKFDPETMVKDEKRYSYVHTDQEEGDENNGYIYGSVSENVTFFMNEGGPATKPERFTNRNRFPSSNYKGLVHPENTDTAYFQYDYQSVLDRINVAIERALRRLSADCTEEDYPLNPLYQDNMIMAVFFDLEGDKICLNIAEKFLETNILLKFSANLYKYIGNGFKCRFYNNPGSTLDENTNDGSFFIDYNPFAWHHAKKLDDEGDVSCFNKFTSFDLYRNYEYYFFKKPGDYLLYLADSSYDVTNTDVNEKDRITRTYYQYKQQYSTLSNWNVCKCILICSSSFPIMPEYYPTLNKNMTLTHYKEDWYVNLIQDVYHESAYSEESQIFDKASTKILDVYYPLSTTGGDIRSCIIYSNENIETGNKIDMVGGMDLENFDIKIKWVDLYGNVYDLYLAPGCSVNIRLCFTRKKILKEEIMNGFQHISSSLETIAQAQVPTVNDENAFDLKMGPLPDKKHKGVNTNYVSGGYLTNGLIIKP